MRFAAALVIAGLAACAAHDGLTPQPPARVPQDAGAAAVVVAPVVVDAAVAIDAPTDAPVEPELWLKGSTHVHARPSGDSSEPIGAVVDWYERHAYDFIALTDHNQVSEIDKAAPTQGVAVRVPAPGHGLIVLAGIELTHNPSGCLPAGDRSKKCRIHVNVMGVTARPSGKLDWADRKTHARIEKYQAAIAATKTLGGIMQINHPQWFWGMSGELLAELGRRGVKLVEIANVQFAKWNRGDKDHPSMEAVWDDALARGVDVWGVASDDAHDYHNHKGDKYPAGGAWVMVKARRDPQAILDALAAGHFYSSTGVALARAEVAGGDLIVEVAASEHGTFSIAMIENGKRVATVSGRTAQRAVPASGYVRAVVTRNEDGKQAWVQPARR